jgi:hypothetical protein
MDSNSHAWWSYLHFHLPNYALAVVFYTLWARFLLSFILPPNSPNYIFRWFVRLTQWICVPVRFITPRFVPDIFVPPLASLWVAVARVALFAVMNAFGLTPRVG